MKVILLSGKAGSGKTTFADILVQQNDFIQIPIAKTIKQYAKDFYGWDGSEETKPRTLLQNLGTEILRDKLKDENFLIRRVYEDILVLNALGYENFVIPDCRYENEIKYLLDKFGIESVTSIRIIRPNYENGLTNEQKLHPSETSLDDYKFDFRIENDGCISELYKISEMLLKSI